MWNNLKPNIIQAGFDTGFIGVEGGKRIHTFTNTAIFFSGMGFKLQIFSALGSAF